MFSRAVAATLGALEGRRGPAREPAPRETERTAQGGYYLRNVADIEPSGRIVVACGCGEALILLGRREDWRSEGRASFECGACGSELSLPDGDEPNGGPEDEGQVERAKTDPEDMSIGEYLKALRTQKTG